MKDYRKTNLIWYIVCIAVAVGFFVAGLLLDNDFLTGFGFAFGLVVVLRTVLLLVRTKDSEAKEEYNAAMSDERTVYIVRKARSAAFYFSVLAEAVVGCVLFLLDNPAAHVLMMVVCFQCILYVICYYVMRSKC